MIESAEEFIRLRSSALSGNDPSAGEWRCRGIRQDRT
jgi:hypothetical protein